MVNIFNILITGSKGFVGENICKSSFNNKYNLITDNHKDDQINDITKLEYFDNFSDKIDLIIHLAAKTSINDSLNNPYETYYKNIVGTLNLLEFAKRKNITNIIFLSTYVYGKPQYLPIDENHPINPHSPYNKSKIIAESLCEDYSKIFGIDIVILRPFYLYGYNRKKNTLISSILDQINTNKIIKLSNKKTSRDFLYISDFIELLNNIVNAFPSGYNIYNVGSGTSYTLTEISMRIANLLNKKVRICYDESIRKQDINEMVADITKISKDFDWKPKIDIDQGLSLTIKRSNDEKENGK
ncbi:MAG: NAD(P)-dependent oxidoreductase [Nitrososphaeraceae archaeon]|nr:NAD(P)-dependent oxidoreductase [Nitrososphaeraceae archaeon]